MKHRSLAVLGAGIAVVGLSALAVVASGQPGERSQTESPTCLGLPRIDRTEIVGDRTIVFYMKDRTIYKNELPQSCPALRSNQPFMYRVAMNQLCQMDTITVLERWGFGFTPGMSCPLGRFSAIDEAAVEALKAAGK
jgi:hypothetical protein